MSVSELSGRASLGSRRTGRPKRLHPPPQSFPPLPPSAQPQPVELACLTYRYLLPLYPRTAESLLHEASAAHPAIAALAQQTSVALEDVVGHWIAAKQKQWDERRLVTLLDGLEQPGLDEHTADGNGGSGGGLLQRTVSTIMQVLTDYNTLRRTQEERLSSRRPDSHQLLFPSSSPPLSASAHFVSSSACRVCGSTPSSRKRKSRPAPSHDAAPPAAPTPPHSHSTRSSSNSSAARGLSALFSSSASPSPPPSAASVPPAATSAPPQSPFAPSSPSLFPGAAMSPMADYLLHIDADELAGDLDFAEQLAQHINDRLLHSHAGENSQPPTAGNQSAAPPSRTLSGLSLTASASTLPSSSSSSLFAPIRLPSLLSSRPVRQWATDDGAEGGGEGGVEVNLPQLTDHEYNAMLDELISTTALAEAVVVEGPAVQRMEEEEREQLQEEEAEEQQKERDDPSSAAVAGEHRTSERREQRKDGQRDGGVDADKTADNGARSRAASSSSERGLSHSRTPQRRQLSYIHSMTDRLIIAAAAAAATNSPHHSPTRSAASFYAEPSNSSAPSAALSPQQATTVNHSTPRKTLAQLMPLIATQHSNMRTEQQQMTHSQSDSRAAGRSVASSVAGAAVAVAGATAVSDFGVLETLTDTALEDILTRIHSSSRTN